MEKRGKVLFFAFAVLFSFFLFSFSSSATNCINFTYSEWSQCINGIQTRTIVSRIPENCTGGNPILNRTCTEERANKSKIDLGFECLEKELKEDCSGATTVQQLAFSILAVPKTDILKKCIEKLEAKEKAEGCFGDSSCTIKDTALAILALDHVKKNTTKYEQWLLSKNKSSSDVEWIVQQDSEGETSCTLKYEGNDYQFTAKENKKLTGNFGPCFSSTYQNHWLRLNDNCFNKEFKIGCNKKFSVSFIYRSPGSSKINVLSNTKEGAQNTEVTFSVNSLCFGLNDCNYEETVWAVLALKKKGYNIKSFIPYIVSSEDANTPYFPEVFSYLILEYDSLYGAKLIKMQDEGKYWEAGNSAYGRYYDTALALYALGHINQQQIKDAKEWVLFAQESNGCWNSKNIRDTAFLLWATQRKTAPNLNPNTSTPTVHVTRCNQGPAGATCIKETECLENGGRVLTSYDCSYSIIPFAVCCNITPSLKSCANLGGEVCSSGKKCTGIEKDSINGKCCVNGQCVESLQSPKVDKDDCSLAGGVCRAKCGNDQEELDEDCSDNSKKCCVKKTASPKTDKKNLLWVWILLGVLIVLAIIAILLKDRIKVFLYKKSNKDSGQKSFLGGGSGPVRPGFPPISGQIRPLGGQSFTRPVSGISQKFASPAGKSLSSPSEARPQVFNKLKEMSK